jgi:outer membrane receptor protein involved in Fe transport
VNFDARKPPAPFSVKVRKQYPEAKAASVTLLSAYFTQKTGSKIQHLSALGKERITLHEVQPVQLPDVFLQAFGDPRTRYATDPAAFWVQDQWRPASGFTVVAGLRYEAQRLSIPFHSPRRNLAPRLGLAWQPHGRGAWVFRAGAGLFYDRYPLAFLNDAIQKDGINGFEHDRPEVGNPCSEALP